MFVFFLYVLSVRFYIINKVSKTKAVDH